MKPFKKAGPSPGILGSALENRVALGLRFRHDSVTVLLYPSEEIGVLDSKTAAILKSLQELGPTIIIELFLSHEQGQDTAGVPVKESASVRLLQIQIYGPEEYSNEVGSTLSSAGMYLQEPVSLGPGVVYRNPHFLSWDDDLETPLFNAARNDPNAAFAAQIEAIMNSSNPGLPCHVDQDPRISTTLRKYDPVKKAPWTGSIS